MIMAYTEIKSKESKKYYYRVVSIRKGKKVDKKRIYLGIDLNNEELAKKIKEADKELSAFKDTLTNQELAFLEDLKKDFAKEPEITLENRYEAFSALFTYNSTAIEGNTLTLQETTRLLFQNIVPADKTLREVNEVLNHKKAFDFILDYNGDITKEFILELHRLVVSNTLDSHLTSQIGRFRTVQVFITGVMWFPPKPTEVPDKITALLTWYSKNKKKIHPLILASYFHTEFEKTHPFVDGNGRVGRLLLNFILHKNKYPMINIPNAIKHKYYDALEKAQTKNNLRPFVKFMVEILKDTKIKL
jgi:Fic family protein